MLADHRAGTKWTAELAFCVTLAGMDYDSIARSAERAPGNLIVDSI